MKRFLFITSLGLCIYLIIGCGTSRDGEELPLPPTVDTVIPELPDTLPWDVYFRNEWEKVYPMDSLSPLLRPLLGRWVWFKGIDWNGRVSETNPSDSQSFLEFFPHGRMEKSHLGLGFQRDGFYALDSLNLYTNYNVSDLPFNSTAAYIHKYSFLEDSNILRLEFFKGVIELSTDVIIIEFYQRIKD